MVDVTIDGLPTAGAAARTDKHAATQIDGTTRETTLAQQLANIIGSDFGSGGSDFDLLASIFKNHRRKQIDVSATTNTFVQADSGSSYLFNGTAASTWTLPDNLEAGTEYVVHNMSVTTDADIQFVPSSSTLKIKGPTILKQDAQGRSVIIEIMLVDEGSGDVRIAKITGQA